MGGAFAAEVLPDGTWFGGPVDLPAFSLIDTDIRLSAGEVRMGNAQLDGVAASASVNDGRIPATVVDDYIVDRWMAFFPKVAVNREVAVSQDGVIAWVTRKDTPKLTALLKQFFTTHVITF